MNKGCWSSSFGFGATLHSNLTYNDFERCLNLAKGGGYTYFGIKVRFLDLKYFFPLTLLNDQSLDYILKLNVLLGDCENIPAA